jgi:translation initiation factor IF-3
MALRPNRPPFKPRIPEEPYKINNLIKATEVRLVGENIQPGVYQLRDAIKMAEEQELDLIEISPSAVPPVCRIADYSKFKYEQKKKQKELKAKQAKVVVKEIRFSPTTDDHDIAFKTKHAISFLKEGAKVKAYVHFTGREIVFKSQGEKLLRAFIAGIEEYAKIEQEPKLEGKRMSVILAPKQTGTPKK